MARHSESRRCLGRSYRQRVGRRIPHRARGQELDADRAGASAARRRRPGQPLGKRPRHARPAQPRGDRRRPRRARPSVSCCPAKTTRIPNPEPPETASTTVGKQPDHDRHRGQPAHEHECCRTDLRHAARRFIRVRARDSGILTRSDVEKAGRRWGAPGHDPQETSPPMSIRKSIAALAAATAIAAATPAAASVDSTGAGRRPQGRARRQPLLPAVSRRRQLRPGDPHLLLVQRDRPERRLLHPGQRQRPRPLQRPQHRLVDDPEGHPAHLLLAAQQDEHDRERRHPAHEHQDGGARLRHRRSMTANSTTIRMTITIT